MIVGISAVRTKNIRLNRSELIQEIQDKNYKVMYLGQESNDNLHSDYFKYNIGFQPIPLARVNMNPIKEIKSITGTIKVFKKNEISHLLAYGLRTFPTVVIAAKLAGVKRIVCVVNGSGRLFEIKGIKGLLLRMISYPMLFIALGLSDHVFFQNSDNLKLFKDKNLLVKTNYSVINGSGVNLNEFSPVDLPKEPIFMFIGRITGDKGVNEFVNAAIDVKKRHPESQFFVIGPMDNDDKSIDMESLNQAVRNGVINIHGRVEDVREYISKARIFVLPSYHEGTPRTVLEAMAMGRPIITTIAPGCKETVEDGRNGFKVSVQDSISLAEKMKWMIENPIKVEKMGKESRLMCEQKYDVNKVNAEIVDELLEGRD